MSGDAIFFFFWIWGGVAVALLLGGSVLAGLRVWGVDRNEDDTKPIAIALLIAMFAPLAAVAVPFVGSYYFGRWLKARRERPAKRAPGAVVDVGEGPHRSAKVCTTCGQRVDEGER